MTIFRFTGFERIFGGFKPNANRKTIVKTHNKLLSKQKENAQLGPEKGQIWFDNI